MIALWGPSEARAEVPAPPDAVFEVISDPTTYPDWLVGAQRIRDVDHAFPAPGSEFAHSVGPAQGVTVDDSTEVLAADPPYRLAMHVRAGVFEADVELVVEPNGDGSTVAFRERPTGAAAAVTPFLRPFLRARNAESLRRLGRYLDDVSRRA